MNLLATKTISRARQLRTVLSTTLMALLLLMCSAGVAWSQNAKIGASLTDALNAANPVDRLEVIVTFEGEGPLTNANLNALDALGLPGLYFQSLPIAGVLATPAQINALAGLDGVRSLWLNEQLQYENDGSTEITGVDRLRADSNLRTAQGLPFSGKGIGVLVNDSGVDGTHNDLKYPDHVVQNVAAQTNLHSLDDLLPVTSTENVPNTDIGGGHGTHVSGIIAGTGAQSGGRYEGVAPGADIIGYGSGAALFILDTIGGFDYALTHQFEYNIRVVSNSFGSTSDVGTAFDPDHPTNVATKRLADRGIIVVFSAGNSGPGEGTITGNFKKAPWVIAVAAGDKSGHLAGFSSRGVRNGGGTVEVDGEMYEWQDRPAITAPGVDVVSVRASTGDSPPDTSLDPAYAYFYTTLSGTSMACPHVSGIVALMLEADPTLNVYDVKNLLQQTTTNMPGRQSWENGTGYVNAYSAVVAALGLRTDFGATVNAYRTFNSTAQVEVAGQEPFSIDFLPVGPTETITFEVADDISLVTASAQVSDNTVALVLLDPNGNRYGSSISLPVLGENIATSGPGVPGTWQLTVRGIGSLSGVGVDPLGVTNGTALPGTIDGTLQFLRTSGFTGLSDVHGHAAQAFIEFAVSNRLIDGFSNGRYRPNHMLKRKEMADYLVMGAGIRQYLPINGPTFTDVDTGLAPFAEAVAVRGAALKDRPQQANGVMIADGSFNPNGNVTRAELAYSFVQALGLQAFAAGYTGDITATYNANGERVTIDDEAEVPAAFRGYVQLALELGIMTAQFSLEQGPFDPFPTIHADFNPNDTVTRAEYAVAATRFYNTYKQGDLDLSGSSTSNRTTMAGSTINAETLAAQTADVPADIELGANYPNPFNPSTQIQFNLPADGPVRLAVYNLLGQRVRLLVDSANLGAGTHQVTFEASDLARGTYLYRLETPQQTLTRRMVLMK